MTLTEIRSNARDCAAQARREIYMRCDRDRADAWARVASMWLEVMRLKVEGW